MPKRNVYVIAGPNGSGKTTFAKQFLPEYTNCQNFINADLIAQGLSPFSPQTAALKAGKLVLSQIHEFSKTNVDFAFESTLAGKSYANLFKDLKKNGYILHLYFLWIPDSGLAITRIKERVSEGGHDVPVNDIIRRFSRSISNFFKLYIPIFDSWILFNNAGSTPKLIAQNNNGGILIKDNELFDRIKKQGQ